MNGIMVMTRDLMIGLEPLRAAQDRLDLRLEELLSASTDENRLVYFELAERISEDWQGVAEQLAETGTPVLMDLIAIYAENLDLLLASREDGLSGPEQALLQRWHEACRHYLQAPADEEIVTDWVTLLKEPAWQAPLSEDDALEFIDGLIECAGSLAEDAGTMKKNSVPPSEETAQDEAGLQADDEQLIGGLADRPVEPVDPALVRMIGAEFGKVADDLTRSLTKFNGASLGEYQQSLSANDFLLENINKASETVGLSGLSYVFRRLWLNVVAKAADDHNYDEECNLFGIALILIQEYLNDIANDQHCSALVRHLREPGWRRPLPEGMQARLFGALNLTLADPVAQRALLDRTLATPGDVSLTIPDDVDDELVQAFLHELPELTENFSIAIQDVIGANPSLERLLDAQRIAHTLKGACNTIGIRGVANLTHSLEAIMEALYAGQELPKRELGDTLLDAADCLVAMSDYLQGQGPAPEQALSILQRILDWDYRIKKDGGADAAEWDGTPETSRNPEMAAENFDNDGDRTAKAMTAIPSALLDDFIQDAAEAGSLGERIHQKLGGLLGESDEVRDMTWRLSELVAEMDRLVNSQNVTVEDSPSRQGFDSLELERYGDLHACLSRLAEAAADIREQNAQMHRHLLDGKNLLIEQRAVQKEQLDRAQSLRLVPVQKIIPRCQRIVRQTARMTGKDIELLISGENTLIDNEILNGLSDALMHLLRNAVDHGIESPERRVKLGKPRTGTIRLSFANDRNALNISCEDDGSGLDTARIRATAHGKGWLNDRQELSDDQIQHLIFRPGFSTRDQASHVSGRGIGMDIIQAQIARMNGVMDLASRQGQGLRVSLNVPSNLYDAAMILVMIDGQNFAVSEHGIQRIFCALDGEWVQDGDGGLHYQDGQHSYAADTLNALLGLGLNKGLPERAAGLLFKASNGDEQVVLVDQVIGYKSLMIRPFGDYLKGVCGVLGGAILGSGQVAPVIDLFELISDSERRLQADSASQSVLARRCVTKTLALVVDDSLSARKASVQLLQDSGFEVQTAIDGLDAIEKIEAHKPDIVLTDLEMPRMNGIELTRYLRASPELRDIPLIMISSRSSEKHRSQADNAGVTLYLTKPFNDDDLIVKLSDLLAQQLIQAA